MRQPAELDLEDASTLEDNWDEEGAPKPAVHTLLEAQHIITRAQFESIQVDSISPDVLGGLGVFLSNTDTSIWIALHNDGEHSLVIGIQGLVTSERYLRDTSWLRIKSFFHNGKESLRNLHNKLWQSQMHKVDAYLWAMPLMDNQLTFDHTFVEDLTHAFS